MTASEPGVRKSFGHYDVEAVLGQGAMGTVYLARDRRIGRRVALKTIQLTPQQIEDSTGDSQFFARLQREAELSGALNHPNIVTLYEAGYEKDLISYLAIEYVEGESLQALLKKRGALGLNEALAITAEILEGLDYAHSKGIIHRDIKPANILLTVTGAVKIADFGIARPAAESNLTQAGMLMGTPNYMAPEQVQGQKLTPRTDLFAVGVVLYQMLTGAKPFAGRDVSEILFKIVNDTPRPLQELRPEIPDVVVTFVDKLLRRNPEERYASGATALLAIKTIREMFPANAPSEIARPADASRTALSRAIPARVFFAIAAAGVILLILVAAMTLRIDGDPTVLISRQKLHEFQEKKRLIQSAEALYEAGSFEASAAQYEEFLKRWPDTPAAREGLERVRGAQMELEVVGTKATPQPKSKKKEEDWLLQQIRSAARKVTEN